MTIEKNFLHKMTNTNIDNIESMDFVLNLDILDGCVHFCDGCFVRKNNDIKNWDTVLEKALTIAKELTSKGLRFRELILGPTDFFSAHNTKAILLDPRFQSLLTLNEKTRITASCVFDSLDKNHFLEIFNILDDTRYFRKEMILEFLVPLHAEKMLNKEAQYIQDNKWALEHFKNKSPKVIDWSYVININNNELLKNNYMTVVDTIKREFNTILEFNPGFFRTNNNQLIDKNLTYWKGFLQKILEGNHYSNLCLTSLDKHHNTANTICLNLIGDKVYFSPFIYEQIIEASDLFAVTPLDGETILNKHLDLQKQGFRYAEKTKECIDCEFLTPCVGRNVLNYMEVKNKEDCLFPDKFKDL